MAVQPVVVTVNSADGLSDNSLRHVEVVQKEAVLESQALSLSQLLNDFTGLEILQTGGAGQAASLFLRGSETDHVVFLLNGLRVRSASLGYLPLESVPLGLLRQVEVLRGSVAGRYGSSAIGGVVGLSTFEPFSSENLQSTSTAKITAGAAQTYGFLAGLSVPVEAHSGVLSLGVDYISSRGFDVCRASLVGGCFVDDPDDDPHERLGASVEFQQHLGNGLVWQGFGIGVTGETHFDGSHTNLNLFSQGIFGLQMEQAIDQGGWRVALGSFYDGQDGFLNGNQVNFFDTLAQNMRVDRWWSQENFELNIGAEWYRETLTSSAFSAARREGGIFLHHQLDLAPVLVRTDLRYNNNTQYGSFISGEFLVGRYIGQQFLLSAAVSRSFKAPSFNELYYPGFGRSDLKPEVVRGAEVFLSSQGPIAEWRLGLFNKNIDDLIAFDSSTFLAGNVDKAKVKGVEAKWDLSHHSWQLSTSLMWLDPRNKTAQAANFNKLLPRRARWSGQIALAKTIGQIYMKLNVNAASSRFDDSANQVRVPGFVVADLHLRQNLSPKWQLQAVMRNLFNKTYETVAFYRQPKRGFYLSILKK